MFMDVDVGATRQDGRPLKAFPAETEPMSYRRDVQSVRQGYMCFRLPFCWNPHSFLLLPDLTASANHLAAFIPPQQLLIYY